MCLFTTSRRPSWFSVALLCAMGFVGCTDADIYKLDQEPLIANKVTVTGRVCTDDPRQANFPVKVLFVVDASQAMAADANDPGALQRSQALEDVFNRWSQDPNYRFAVISYGGKAQVQPLGAPPVPGEGDFTRDSSRLSAAASSFAVPNNCFGNRCRDMRAALSLAESIVSGDVLSGNKGDVSRTSYVVILFAGGPPVPPVERCACRDVDTETNVGLWSNCPWTECDGCQVTCPANSTCTVSQCIDDLSGTIVPPIGLLPTVVPDTFSQWVLPANHTYNLGALPPGSGECMLSCVSADGGHPDSCEQRVLRDTVSSMRETVLENGGAQFQFHTTYLPDTEPWPPGSVWEPPCGADADRTRTEQVLIDMADAGGGTHLTFPSPAAISFEHVNLFAHRDPLVFKEFLVTNTNVLVRDNQLNADTDADGLSDTTEETLGTCASDADSDGDGIGDAVEVRLASDPLASTAPQICLDLLSNTITGSDLCAPEGGDNFATKSWETYSDDDRDGLNECEERLLGIDPSLFDSDADGLPDKVEFVAGTNYAFPDSLDDVDFDGIFNRAELREHTDPQVNDIQEQLDRAYRYDEVDEGIRTIVSASQPCSRGSTATCITGVRIQSASETSVTGIGWLRFDPGPPATLAWRDPEDTINGGDFGPAVEVSSANNEGITLVSSINDDRSIVVTVDGPSAYPAQERTERIVLSSAERNCLTFRVRNITLMETGLDPVLRSTGNNTVSAFFAEAPEGRTDSYGIFRVLNVRLVYHLGPPETREPDAAELVFTDDDFCTLSGSTCD